MGWGLHCYLLTVHKIGILEILEIRPFFNAHNSRVIYTTSLLLAWILLKASY